jgi:hypothetical protein
MSTQWKRQYGPIVTPDANPHVIIPASTSGFVIGKFAISNNSVSAATAVISVTPVGGALAQVYRRDVPGYPIQGGCLEVVEIEGQTLNAGDTLTFQDLTGGVLIPFISGVAYTP